METKIKLIEEKTYIARDGQEFKTQAACERYELNLNLNNKKWFQSRIDSDKDNYPIYDLEFYYRLKFFWIDNKEEFEELCIYLNELVNLYKFKGSGWYTVIEDHGDSDWIDVVRIEYLSDYLQEHKDNLNKWTNRILELVQSKEVKEI